MALHEIIKIKLSFYHKLHCVKLAAARVEHYVFQAETFKFDFFKKKSEICFMNFSKYIEIDTSKRFGKPIIKGTRISVADVLNWLANGMSKQEIIIDFPELEEAHINACLFYASSRESHLRIAS